jgi:hypothetical protein
VGKSTYRREFAASSSEVRCIPATPGAGGYPRVVTPSRLRDLITPAAVSCGKRLTASVRSTAAVNRVSPLPSAGKLTSCGSRYAWGVAVFPPASAPIHPPIGRPTDPSPRAVKGATALSPSPALWSPGRRGVGGSLIACAAAPTFLRAGRKGSIELSKNVCREVLVASIRVPARGTPVGTQTAAQIRPQQTSPTKVAIACNETLDRGHTLFGAEPELQCLQALPVETWRDTARRPSHHPATAAPAMSRSALGKSNRSSMAATGPHRKPTLKRTPSTLREAQK